ncbi:MAG: helicase-related protein [Thermoguttaceae bacterium]|jgi:superfamily II DNA or RNA helicase
MQPTFAPGSLVNARNRDWIVLPGSTAEFLLVKPLEGSDDETAGILTRLEPVSPATFELPTLNDDGDFRSGRMLRDAFRLGARNCPGPFRCFGQINVEPRPYQIVPLMLALKQDPIRLLIADDVGVGKTIESALIVREMLDRGECERFCILCPPCLAEQWEYELYDKFHIDATLVLPNTIKALERRLAPSESVFEAFKYTIASIDFVKSSRYSADFLRAAPELVVIDEAHSVATDPQNTRQLRYQLAAKLCEDPDRNVILVTATPHTGKQAAFRSLLGLLDQKFLDEERFPDDLSGDDNIGKRRELARYFVQRRRGDVLKFMGEDTVFPKVVERNVEWPLSTEYRELFNEAFKLAGVMTDKESKEDERTQRIRHWSALSLLRALSSSPAAAAATLERRSQLTRQETEDGEIEDDRTIEEIDSLGRQFVLDTDAHDANVSSDVVLGADCEQKKSPLDRKLKDTTSKMAAIAKKLCDEKKDEKLRMLVQQIRALDRDNYSPIVFCRFIETAQYLGKELAAALPGFNVEFVTGQLPPEERERRVETLGMQERPVLVCTDCLSEGVNLQDAFNAVVHYDLSWNPTRHEQREGRVNRFGQRSPEVRTVSFSGKDNVIDRRVVDVLLKKHKKIKNSLGISIPIPADSSALFSAILSSALAEWKASAREDTPMLPGLESYKRDAQAELERIEKEWESEAQRAEKQSQTFFAHRALSGDVKNLGEVLKEARAAIGIDANELREFVVDVLRRAGAHVSELDGDVYDIDLTNAPEELVDAVNADSDEIYDEWRCVFGPAAKDDAEPFTRTHPFVQGLASLVVNSALDPEAEKDERLASRFGVARIDGIEFNTTLVLLRFRFSLKAKLRSGDIKETLVEDSQIVGFAETDDDEPRWLEDKEIEEIISRKPSGNISDDLKREVFEEADAQARSMGWKFEEYARERAEALKTAHEEVRQAVKTARNIEVEPKKPVDVVGLYVCLP